MPKAVTEPALSPSGKVFDTEVLFEFIKSEGQPALAALVANAFRLKIEGSRLTLYFDRSHANLIPMLRGQNAKAMEDMVTRCFGGAYDLNYSIGNDPVIRARRDLETRALEEVKANPKVQFILDAFGGSIVKCEILDDNKE